MEQPLPFIVLSTKKDGPKFEKEEQINGNRLLHAPVNPFYMFTNYARIPTHPV